MRAFVVHDVRYTELVSTLQPGPTLNYTIHGITILDAELYVLRTRRNRTPEIAVFDLNTHRYVYGS